MPWREGDVPWKVDPASHVPVWIQLRRQIEASIFAGDLEAGDRLPTVRAVAVALKINANTVAKVYKAMEREGLLRTRRGSGTYVADGTRRVRLGLDRDRRLRMWIRSLLAEAEDRGYTRDEFAREAMRQASAERPLAAPEPRRPPARTRASAQAQASAQEGAREPGRTRALPEVPEHARAGRRDAPRGENE